MLQDGRLETYQIMIFDQFLAIIEKNGKSFGRLQASAYDPPPQTPRNPSVRSMVQD